MPDKAVVFVAINGLVLALIALIYAIGANRANKTQHDELRAFL